MDTFKGRKRFQRNPLRAIRSKCLECCGGSPKEVRLCPDETCALHPFRQGRNPFQRSPKRAVLKVDRKTSPASWKDPEKTCLEPVQLSLF